MQAPAPAGPSLRLARFAAFASALLGFAVLVGWSFDMPSLRSVVPGAVQMKANTAFGLIGLAVALCASTTHAPRRWHRLGDLSAGFVVLLGALTLCEYAFDWNAGIDELVFRDTAAAFNQAKGRMSPYSAVAFMALGCAAACLARSRWRRLRRASAGLAAGIGFVSLIGYLWNASEIVTDRLAPPVALNTALAFSLLGLAIYLLADANEAQSGRHRSRLETLVLGGFAPTALIVLVGTGVTYQSGAGYAAATEQVAHAQEVRAQIAALHAAIADADAVVSDPALAAEGPFARLVDGHVKQARERLAQLGRLVADDPAQLQRERELAPLVEARLRLMQQIAQGAQAGDALAARRAVVVDARQGLAQQIRQVGLQMEQAERERLQAQLARAEQHRQTTLVSLLATLAVLAAMFVLLLRTIQREMQARGTAEAALRDVNAELEERVAARTEQLSFQQAFLRRVIDLNRNFIFAKDRHGRFVLANQALADALGTNVDALVGQGQERYTADADEARALAAAEQAVIELRREVVIAEEKMTAPGGRVRWLSSVKRPILSADGTDTLLLGVSADITDRKAAEDALQALTADLERRVQERTLALHESNAQLERARRDSEVASRTKSAFLANMSHEIRTPLSAIIGLTNLLQRDSHDALQRDRLGKVASSAHHLLAVINDILDLSRIEAGKLELHNADFSTEALLSQASALVAQTVQAKKLAFSVDPGALPATLHGDATRLLQALLNLLGNAVKFTEAGSVAVRVELIERSAAGLLVKWSVSDTGIGIQPDRLQHLFTAFEQADGSTTRRFGGSGLGLSITRQLARLMGGDAGADSEPGLGSRFWFSARLAPARAVVEATPTASAAASFEPALRALKARHGGKRILLAEDNLLNQEVAGEWLRMAGLEVDIASNGRLAVEHARAGGHALVLMDMQMPELGGIEATHRLRRAVPPFTVPIIAMTANAYAEDRAACLAAGMNDHLVKPINPDALYAALLRWLTP